MSASGKFAVTIGDLSTIIMTVGYWWPHYRITDRQFWPHYYIYRQRRSHYYTDRQWWLTVMELFCVLDFAFPTGCKAIATRWLGINIIIPPSQSGHIPKRTSLLMQDAVYNPVQSTLYPTHYLWTQCMSTQWTLYLNALCVISECNVRFIWRQCALYLNIRFTWTLRVLLTCNRSVAL